MNKKEAYKIVYDDLMKYSLFRGNFDAKHGTKDYMLGIRQVMENIAYGCDEHNFADTFDTNYVESIERVKGVD